MITESHDYNELVPKYILIVIGGNREGWNLGSQSAKLSLHKPLIYGYAEKEKENYSADH